MAHGKRDLTDGIKLRILGWGDDPGLSRQTQCNHKILIRRKPGGQEGREM